MLGKGGCAATYLVEDIAYLPTRRGRGGIPGAARATPPRPASTPRSSFLVDAYRRAYLRERPLEPDRQRYYEALRTVGFLVEVGVHHQAEAGVIAPRSKPTAFASPRVLAGATARIRALTGVEPRLG